MQGVIVEMDVSNIKCEYLNGAYSELANLLGIEAVLKIHSAYRGQQITFPVQLFSKEFLKSKLLMNTTDIISNSLLLNTDTVKNGYDKF